MTEPLDHRTTRRDSGEMLHTWVPRGAVRALVQLQHGFGEYAERFVTEYGALVPRLVERGYEVWGLDLEGHGRTAGRRGIVDLRVAVDRHVALRQEMLRRDLPVLLFGHSLGGLVTAASIAAAPAGVRAGVLSAPALPAPTPGPVRAGLVGLSGRIPGAPAPIRKAPVATLSHRPDVVARAEADPLMYTGRVPMRTGATALEAASRVWRAAPTWRVPVLVLQGGADRWVDPKGSRRFAATVGEPTARLRWVPGGYHELLHDTDGQALVGEVLDFLDEHTVG